MRKMEEDISDDVRAKAAGKAEGSVVDAEV
jgi:hypothetical protein